MVFINRQMLTKLNFMIILCLTGHTVGLHINFASGGLIGQF